MAESTPKKSNVTATVERMKANAAAKSAPGEQKIADAQAKYDSSRGGFKGRGKSRAALNELNAAKAEQDKKMARTRDTMEGVEFGASVLGEDGLGRMGTDAEVQENLARFKDISEQGLSRQELAAERAQATRSIDSATQTGMRGLQAKLARMGVKGAVAGQQMIQRELGGAQQKADLAQNLFLKSEQVKREGLKDYSQRLGEVKSFDLGQAAKEKDVLLQSGLGFAQMGSSERTSKYAAEQSRLASIASARASRPSCFIAGTEIEMLDGSFKKIEDVKVTDILKNDNFVQIVGQGMSKDFYNWKGIVITGEHCVYEGGWIEVKNSLEADKLDLPLQPVYNIYSEKNEIIINGNKVSDFSSLYTLGGFSAIIRNFYKKIQKRGLQFIENLVGKMGMDTSFFRNPARDRFSNDER